jgi:hypothetical protein
MKAELENIHRALVADTRQLSYTMLKSLLRNAFNQHPSGRKLEIPEADVEKTITFFEAVDRVRELHPSVGTKRDCVGKDARHPK